MMTPGWILKLAHAGQNSEDIDVHGNRYGDLYLIMAGR